MIIEPHRNPRTATFVALGLLIAMIIGSVIFVKFFRTDSVTTPVATPTPTATPTATPVPLPTAAPGVGDSTVIFYTDEVSSTETSDRTWPTENIYQKIGLHGTPVLLATLGKVGEYPTDFRLSSDHKTLYISLESRLIALDIASKAITTIFTPVHRVDTYVLSPDGKEVLIWDEDIYVTPDPGYSVHRYNLATKKDTVIISGDALDNGYPYFEVWRPDNKVAISLGFGEGSNPGSFDIATGKTTILQDHGFLSHILSNDGMYETTYKDSTVAICDAFGGSASSTQTIFDPVSVKSYGDFGNKDKDVSAISFSPDNKLVLYSEATPWTDQADCEKPLVQTYYTADVATGKTITPVTDIEALLKEWKVPSLHKADFITNLQKTYVVESYVQ